MAAETRECADLEAWTRAHLDHMDCWVDANSKAPPDPVALRKANEAASLLEDAATRGHKGAREALAVLRACLDAAG